MLLITQLLYYEIVYLDEWIDFHKKQGFEYFYVWIRYGTLEFGTTIERDDNKFNNIKDKYSNEPNIVFYHTDKDRYIHVKHFFNEKTHLKHLNDWCAILDIDEFIHCPVPGKKICDIVEFYNLKNIDAVYVNWVCFGSNGIIDNPSYKVVDVFKEGTDIYSTSNYQGKTFFKVKDYKNIPETPGLHKLIFIDKYYANNGVEFDEWNNKNKEIALNKGFDIVKINIGNKNFPPSVNYHLYPVEHSLLIINHYMIKSLKEYENKIKLNPKYKQRYQMETLININKTNKFILPDYTKRLNIFDKVYAKNDKSLPLYKIKEIISNDTSYIYLNFTDSINNMDKHYVLFDINDIAGYISSRDFGEFILYGNLVIKDEYKNKNLDLKKIKEIISNESKTVIIITNSEDKILFNDLGLEIKDNIKCSNENIIILSKNVSNNVNLDEKLKSIDNNYKNKYIKYKLKYLNLKNRF